jgi:hypothetical protein
MKSLLGKITNVKKRRKRAAGGLQRLEVSFKPACVMPARGQPPEWLKDQTLKVARQVRDPREVGGVGDSIMLAPAEAAQWLYPLAVEPEVSYGAVPAKLELSLRWWKDKKPGEFTVFANGRRVSGKFKKNGEAFAATVATRAFFHSEPTLPLSFEISFDKLKVGSAVLPAEGCFQHRLRTVRGERHRLESPWYAADVVAEGGGGILRLLEKGREVDHFRTDSQLVSDPLDQGGHRDRVRFGWQEKLSEVTMTSATARDEGHALQLCLEGVLDEGKNARTAAACTLMAGLPLLVLRREALFGPAKKQEDKKKDEKPKEPVDDMSAVSLGFRSASPRDRNSCSGSRIVSVEKERLAVVRRTHMNEGLWNGWRLSEGWALVEHPQRDECMLYVFNTENPPVLGTWAGQRVITLEPRWLPMPLRPGDGAGFTTALSAGEVCGATVGGAWVACRRPVSGGVECALVGRIDGPERGATFRVGRRSADAPLEPMLLPGVGTIHVASAVVPRARMNYRFDATAGGIPARRKK